ncbi:MAG: hypothetical protein F6K58_10580 [Symploca sp. SIO2E9]|nr:hypothetical protein [Symploca sp. SIO2E9]
MLNIGFTVIAYPDSVKIQPYARQLDLAKRLISTARDDACTVIVMGQLRYREDSLQRLRGRVDDQVLAKCEVSDAVLALACCRADGIEGLCHLEGDFAVVCYNRATRSLVALRDPMGGYPLFWLQQGDVIALSTSIRPLIDLLPTVDFDIEYAADYLVFPNSAISEMPIQRTAYKEVQRLLPGWLCEANLSARQVFCQPYWHWRDKLVAIDVDTVEEAGSLVRESLEAAVRERMSSRALTASHFSGGFDSTGVALLACRLGQKSGKSLQALSLIYNFDPILATEQEYIQAALESKVARESNPLIAHHSISADDLLYFDEYQNVPLLDEPSSLIAEWSSVAVVAKIAARAGADSVMTGRGADHLFVHSPKSLIADLLMKGKVSQALQMVEQYSYFNSSSALGIMVSALGLLIQQNVMEALVRGGQTSYETMTLRTVPPWLTKDFTRHYHLRQRTLAWQYPLARTGSMTTDSLPFVAGNWFSWYAGLLHGAVMSQPYFDPRMIVLALSLPMELNLQPGRMKPILAAALHDVLPEKIIKRDQKVNFGLRLNGLSRHHEALEAMIQQAPIPNGILDRSILIDSLAKAALGVYQNAQVVKRLITALSYLIWLSRRETWRQLSVPTIALQEVSYDELPTT